MPWMCYKKKLDTVRPPLHVNVNKSVFFQRAHTVYLLLLFLILVLAITNRYLKITLDQYDISLLSSLEAQWSESINQSNLCKGEYGLHHSEINPGARNLFSLDSQFVLKTIHGPSSSVILFYNTSMVSADRRQDWQRRPNAADLHFDIPSSGSPLSRPCVCF